MSYNRGFRSAATGGAFSCLSMLVIYLGIIISLAFWTQRNIDFWMTHFKGHAVHVPFILDCLICMVSPAALIGNIVAEIARIYVAS